MSADNRCATCVSADKCLEKYISETEHDTSHHRAVTQELKCGFGLKGTCCRLCANGPCRITPASPRGTCGATADAIVARNFLRSVAAGAGCYIHVVETTARNLLETAKSGGEIRGERALDSLCDKFGIAPCDKHERARLVAEAVLRDIHLPDYETPELVKKLSYAPRYANWEKLGILPGGAKSDIVRSIVKGSTNLNSDPVDMLLDCLRLGVSTGVYGLMLTNQINDVLLGEPVIRVAPVGLRVIDPDYINIMVTGHQHSIFVDLQDKLIAEDAVARAKALGAKGFKIVGCTCVGQDLQLRGERYKEIFDGHAGNNYTSEAVLATGAIDAVLSEFNCTLPGIEPICDALQIRQICLDDVAKKANATLDRFGYNDREDY